MESLSLIDTDQIVKKMKKTTPETTTIGSVTNTTRDVGLRRKLQGSELKRKIQRTKSRCQKTSVIFDKQEYHDDNEDYDVFDELVFEMSLDTISSQQDQQDFQKYETEEISSASSEINSSFEEIPSLSSSCMSLEEISLDGSPSMPKNSICVDVLQILQDPDTPELFLRATNTTQDWNCVPAVNRHMHTGGDLHTICNVIMSWMKARQSDKNICMKEWARVNGVHVGTLKKFLYVLKPHKLEDVEKAFGNLSDTICAMFKSNIAVYQGHIDAGFKLISSGDVIPCCFSSTIRLLDKMPEYVICTPRHIHASGQKCYFLTPISKYEIQNLVNAILVNFEDECLISPKLVPVSYDCILAQCQREKLIKTWPKDSPYILDSVDFKGISVQVPSDMKERALRYLDDYVQEVKDAHLKKIEAYRYPPGSDVMNLEISKGGVCEHVCFDSNVSRTKNMNISQIKETVTVNVLLDVSTWHCTDENKLAQMCSEYITYKFNDLNERDFVINTFSALLNHKLVPMKIEFISHVTARRGLLFLSEDDCVKITNMDDVEKDLRTYHLFIHQGVMSVIGDNVHKALQKMKNSPKYSVDYTVNIDDDISMIIYELSFKSNRILNMKLDGLRATIQPLVFKLTKPTAMRQRLIASTCGVPVLSLLGNFTETFMYLPQHADEIHVYGDRAACKNAFQMVEEYLNVSSKVWKCIGKPKLCGGELPNGISSYVIKSFFQHSNEEIRGSVYIDRQTKDYWILAPNKEIEFGVIIQRLEKVLLKVLENVYGLQMPLELLSFDIPKLDAAECGICYSLVTGKPYVTEACGHIYCIECLRTQIKTTLGSGTLPLTCAECDTAFSLDDIANILSMLGVPRQRKLLKCSINNYVAVHHGEIRFCPKPDCVGLFKITETILACAVCRVDICPECFDCFHLGMSCERYKEYGKWMALDPKNRKRCPKCSMGIEKNGGCNNVTCVFCKSSICWVCLERFDSSSECYNHLDTRNHWR